MQQVMLTPSFNLFPPMIEPVFSVSQMEAEPMLFSSDLNFAEQAGGPITQWALAEVRHMINVALGYAERAGKNYGVSIDTRTHMLMPGFFPAIPGWHCDAVPRSSYHGQPDLDAADLDHVLHIVICVGAEGADPMSYTEFIPCNTKVYIDTEGENIWTQVHKQTEQALSEGRATKIATSNGKIAMFDQHGIHRATPATSRGWRWFFRATVSDAKPQNSIRHQTQVYITEESGGW